MRRTASSLIVALLFLSLFVGAPAFVNQAQGQSVPAGIVYSIPITLNNTQPVPTPAPFQQMIEVNSSAFYSYESPNLQNVEFFNADGTLIPSFLESGNSNTAISTTYWLNLEGGIPAESSLTIYLGFASLSTNLFNAQTIGEAPQLSPVYGEYDNGATVFTYYTNFAGDSLPSGWAAYYPDSITYFVNNGLTVTNSVPVPLANPQIYYTTSLSNPYNTVIDAYMNVSSQSIACIGYLYGPNGRSQDTFVGGDNNVWSITNFDGMRGSSVSMGAGSVDSNWHVMSYFPSASAGNGWLDYAHFTMYSGNFRFFDSKPGLFGEGISASMEAQWFRQRALPPNGVMPAASGLGLVSGLWLMVNQPISTSYHTDLIPVQLTSPGATSVYYNVLNGSSWVFASNQTYSSPTQMRAPAGFFNGTYVFCAWASNSTATVAETISFTVSITLFVSVSPASVSLYGEQPQLFTANVYGNTAPYSYQWYLNGAPVSGATNSTWTFIATWSGSYEICVDMNDSLGEQATSTPANVTVNGQYCIGEIAGSIFEPPGGYEPPGTPKTIPIGGQAIGTWGIISLSSFPLRVIVDVLPQTSIPGTEMPNVTVAANCIIQPNSTLDLTVTVSVPDCPNDMGQSWTWLLSAVAANPTGGPGAILQIGVLKFLVVTVDSEPSVSVSPASTNLDIGRSQLFNSTISNGTSPYSYQWYLNGVAVSGATNANWTFTPASAGSYTVYLNVTDIVGVIAISNTVTVTVMLPDVAVTNVTSSKTEVIEGKDINVNITVKNEGSFTETFNVTFYANSTVLGERQVALASENSTTVSFAWNTTSFQYSHYNLTAYASPVLGETNVANNRFVFGIVTVTVPGDVNGDKTVNVLDLISIAAHLGHQATDYVPYSTDWYKFSNCDLNSDGKINVLDLITCATHLGQHW